MSVTARLKDAIEAYKNGDESAFSTIYEESKGYIYTCVSNTLNSDYKNEDMIQDIMQDTYLDISKDINKLENVDSFLSWAATIAKRKCYAVLEKDGKYVLLGEEQTFDNLPDADNVIPEEIVINKEKQEKVREVINNDLTEGEKDCVVSYFYNDMKQSEIAEELGMPENTVKSNIHRAKSKMRQALEGVLVLAVVASIALLLVNSQILKEATKNKKEEPTTVTQESTQENTTEAATEGETEGILDETAVPGGIIPTGCTYYVAATDKTLVAGEKFPETLGEGDKYITRDYEYYFRSSEWNVSVLDNTQTSYGKILSSVMGEDITLLNRTFKGCESLVEAPEIPDTVDNMIATFDGCISLVKAPEIPESVASMYMTFADCTSLVKAPVIPERVLSMEFTFSGCTSLEKAPEIPEGVTDMHGTFWDCTSLVEAPEIPESVTTMIGTFWHCTSLVEAPEIPSSVANMASTFSGCTSLTGNIVINANLIYNSLNNPYGGCFRDVNFAQQNITLSGTSNMLKRLRSTSMIEYIIPEDCSYYIASTGKNLNPGDAIPYEPGVNDKYITKDYEYTYAYFRDYDELGGFNDELHWYVSVRDKTKENYEEIVDSLHGNPIRYMDSTFAGCTNLKVAPKIPDTVTEMYRTFENCSSLVEAPVIPESVISMDFAFSGCTSLKTAPVIPESVEDMYHTFKNCTSLTGNVVINANPTTYDKCFYGLDLMAQELTLSGSSAVLENIKNTENELTTNKDIVEYGDTVRVSLKYYTGAYINQPDFTKHDGGECEFVVDVLAQELDFRIDELQYINWKRRLKVEKSGCLGKKVGDTFSVVFFDEHHSTNEYTILEIIKGE